ncbi:low molecular weight protein-tyrosine-phosphatase [Pelagibius sp. Alg239-R121]|uniref:low molecular weight protein-tyrosine-phosphatase n=1 Tax=Pelagibius sp. Alg239-R121 TaxID=2993448 RepID=UPI0024A631D3|nr:low molecular weight protein-tyrosine-phosphatase [Pelagibius sp. Alg239-R121]
MTPLQVLFICTGNICRSPSAEGVLRHRLAEAGLADRITIDSAATHDYHTGEPPNPRAVRCCAKRGYDLTGLRARRLTREDFENFDVISVMDRGHMEILKSRCPSGEEHRLKLFLDHAEPPLQGQDVPDPYYGGPEDYEAMLDLIEEGMTGLLDHLRSRL